MDCDLLTFLIITHHLCYVPEVRADKLVVSDLFPYSLVNFHTITSGAQLPDQNMLWCFVKFGWDLVWV